MEVGVGDAEEGAEVTYFGNQQSAAEPLSDSALENEEDVFASLRRRPTMQYRETSIGRSLKGALDELLEHNKLSAELYDKTLRQFDRTMLCTMSQKLTSKVAFKAEKLRSYKYLDGVWSFDFNHVEFREYNSFANVANLKILSFDAKVPDLQRLAGGKRHWGSSQGGAGDSGTNAKSVKSS